MAPFVHIEIPQFQQLLVILIRVAGILAAMPVLTGRSIPAHVKVALVVVIGLVLVPVVQVPSLPQEPAGLTVGLLTELLVGLVIGIGLRLLFVGIELAGDIMGTQMGFGMVQLLDPTAGHQMPLMSHFQVLLGSLVFLSLNGHFMVVEALASSFDLVVPFTAVLSDELVEEVLRLFQGMFVVALKLAAPVLVTALLINLGLAMMGRTVTQLNVFLMSQPLTIAAGLLAIGAALPFMFGLYETEFVRVGETVRGMMAGLGRG